MCWKIISSSYCSSYQWQYYSCYWEHSCFGNRSIIKNWSDTKSSHLDTTKIPAQQQSISNSIISHCKNNTNISFIIFSSSKTLLRCIWLNFFFECDQFQILNLLCIDEIHMFVQFDCSFRPFFQLPKEKFFSKFWINNTTTSVPILLMSATFSKEIQSILEKMIGIDIGIR